MADNERQNTGILSTQGIGFAVLPSN